MDEESIEDDEYFVPSSKKKKKQGPDDDGEWLDDEFRETDGGEESGKSSEDIDY